ncbi:grip and coiled-coil domain-containing protein 1 [Plakobranchus ocellatus]|uniref:Grip and coiled-coil domain-containing protein 1 n=1 Tax=Plakobranchus ocellatus TaxID=259542 RepID=A0AAV4BWF5_9GAST|nr:grip and coiled-coil domain-containing protein 1 [Plakobranchus ocellatus]
MEKASRAELIETVSAQKEQLQLYKNKLRDVVSAYKSVVKEKEALEASFSALNSVTKDGSNYDAASETSSEGDGAKRSDEGENTVSPEDPLGVNKKETKDDNSALREQIRTLSTSLTTLSQEKNKLEASFIAERKQLKHELEEIQFSLGEEKKHSAKQAEELEAQISELKSRIRSHQLEREKEETDHALMLRELQTLLAKERSSKELLEVRLEEAQNVAKNSTATATEPAISQVYELQIQQLQEELRKVRDRLKSAEVKASQPSPFVVELQKEMANLKADYQLQVETERQKAVEAETRLRTQSRQNEERVSSLEAKLSELSQVVGNYERTKFQDQQAISKLKERVTQLDLENTALAKAAHISPEKQENVEGDSLDAEQIVDKIMQLRKQLRSAVEKSENQINLASIFVEDLNKADEESPRCREYKQELESIKEEFERYKLRAQSVLKNKNKESGPSKETELLKGQVSELRDKLRMTNFHHREECDEFQAKVENLSKALLAQEEKFKADLAGIKAEHRKEIGELELEARKQRERTVSMLAEKDVEIHRLRAFTGQGSGAGGYDSYFSSSYWSVHGSDSGCDGHDKKLHYQPSGRSSTGAEAEGGACDEEAEAVTKLLDLPRGVQNEAAFLHFAQERSRMEVAMSGLRKQKRELESALRDLHVSAAQKEEQLREEVQKLTEHFAEIDRHTSREGANVEYLKNVLLQFLTSVDVDGKRSMLKALMTILQFSPRERQRVELAHSRGWWGS